MERSKEEKNIRLALILILINIIYATICYLFIYPNIDSDSFQQNTRYIITTDFLIAFIPLNIITAIFFLKIGKLTFSEIGLKKSGLLPAIFLIFIIWWAAQLFYFYIDLFFQINPLIKPSWSNPIYYPYILGEFITEFLGNSLFEEILYRGVLFSQLFLYFKSKNKFSNEENQIVMSILISQILFALAHIPNRFISGYYALDEAFFGLISPLIFGVFISYVYYLTNNLYICIGLHGIGNISVSIFTLWFPPSQWSLLIPLFFVFFYILFNTNNQDPGLSKKINTI